MAPAGGDSSIRTHHRRSATGERIATTCKPPSARGDGGFAAPPRDIARCTRSPSAAPDLRLRTFDARGGAALSIGRAPIPIRGSRPIRRRQGGGIYPRPILHGSRPSEFGPLHQSRPVRLTIPRGSRTTAIARALGPVFFRETIPPDGARRQVVSFRARVVERDVIASQHGALRISVDGALNQCA